MPIERFELARLAPVPWKNGGGVTREIVRRPEGAGMDGFDWRASVADIAADGQFSIFPGMDRALVLLEGAGARLLSRDGAVDYRWDTPLVPFAFAGEAEVACTLFAGPCRDCNVMARRDRLRLEAQTLRGVCRLPPSARGLLFAVRGAWRLQARRPEFNPAALDAGAGVWWDGEPVGWRVAPAGVGAALLAVQLWPCVPAT